MAGRIRTIKPELLEDGISAGLSDTAFRLFVGMILLADDYGVLRAEPGYLQGHIHWKRSPSIPVEDALVELLGRLVIPFTVGDQTYAFIKNWEKHQKVAHRGKRRLPSPPESLVKSSGESHETLRPDLRPSTIDQGPSTSAPESPAEVPVVADSGTIRVRPNDPASEPFVSAAYGDGIVAARGGKCTKLERGEMRVLLAVLDAHCEANDLPGRCAWLRKTASEHAKAKQGVVSVYSLRDWLNSNRPSYGIRSPPDISAPSPPAKEHPLAARPREMPLNASEYAEQAKTLADALGRVGDPATGQHGPSKGVPRAS